MTDGRQERTEEAAPVLKAEEARQASWGKPVLWVLVISTVAVIVGVLGVFGIIS
jgi:hypothetical protein